MIVARRACWAAPLASLLLMLGPSPEASAHPRPPMLRAAPAPGARLAPDSLAIQPASIALPKRFYLANDDHTDYMWAADDATYRVVLPRMLDNYMAQAENTATFPVDARAKFSCDGSLWVWEYGRNRTPQQFQRLIDHLRAGTITMPLNTCVQLYGAMPAEAVLRSFYYAGRLERREDLRFPLVVPMENQTLPGGVASLWAGAGARYAWKGICDCNTQIDAGDRPREIYRFTGPDGSSVLMKWNSLFGTNQSIGGYAEARDPAAAVDLMDHDPGFLSRWPFSIAGAFGYGWDDVETYTDAFQDASLTLSDASRRVIASNEVDFFLDFEATYGPQIGSFSGSFGDEWDLLPASLGEVTAAMKRGMEKLRAAEALAGIASLYDSSFMDASASARDSAWLACGLYYDHSWAAGPAVTESQRAAWQRSMQRALSSYVDLLHSQALSRVAALVPLSGQVERHLVFNPLSWRRTDFADLRTLVPEPRHVMDAVTGLEVPSQSLMVGGEPVLRILAGDVPSVGYRVFEVVAGPGRAFPPSATLGASSLDNAIYGVTVGARGQITSLLDHKDGQRELVGAGSALNDLGFGSGSPMVESAGPVSTTLRVSAGGSPAHETRITLYVGIDRVDVENRINANFAGNLAYASAFDLTGATMRHEEVGMIAKVARASQGGDYADQNTRTDYLTLNHFVDLSEASRGVTVSSWDSQFFQAGNSTATALDATTPSVRLVVGMQVDGAGRGIGSQGGDSFFLNRYSFRSHGAWDQAAAMRMALEHQNPLVTARTAGGNGAPLPATSWSLLTVDPPDALLWSVKPSEEGIGHGLIARVWNQAEAARSVVLTLPSRGIASAQRTTHIETDLAPAPVFGGRVYDRLERQQMGTWRLAAYGRTGADGFGPAALSLTVFPNPSRAGDAHVLTFILPSEARVRLALYDLRGAAVATILDGVESAGPHSLEWRAGQGTGLRPGVYFLRLEAGGESAVRRVVLLE